MVNIGTFVILSLTFCQASEKEREKKLPILKDLDFLADNVKIRYKEYRVRYREYIVRYREYRVRYRVQSWV